MNEAISILHSQAVYQRPCVHADLMEAIIDVRGLMYVGVVELNVCRVISIYRTVLSLNYI